MKKVFFILLTFSLGCQAQIKPLKSYHGEYKHENNSICYPNINLCVDSIGNVLRLSSGENVFKADSNFSYCHEVYNDSILIISVFDKSYISNIEIGYELLGKQQIYLVLFSNMNICYSSNLEGAISKNIRYISLSSSEIEVVEHGEKKVFVITQLQ